MKSWALILVVVAGLIIPFHKAEAKKAPKRKIVAIGFTEAETKERSPASIDGQKEAAAEARHIARLAEASINFPEFIP